MALQGIFKPINISKYKGNWRNIVYRSSWELKCMQEFDKNPAILWWSSEELVIPYVSPVDGQRHRYFPDFLICKKGPNDKEPKTILIEVKPAHQTVEPKKKKRITKAFVNEVFTYGVNQAKWAAAKKVCEAKGWHFAILTEAELGIK